jgi:phytoene desaturase
MKNNTNKHIIIVGAGPGGLTTAMLLSHRGFQVTVFEKKDLVGGRNGCLRLGPFTFDIGPTFLMLKNILDEVFEEAGTQSAQHLHFTRLEPMYRLQFNDTTLEPTTDKIKMAEAIAQTFPGQEKGLDKYYSIESRRFKYMYPCLQKNYSAWTKMLSRDLIRALPLLSLGRSLMDVLGDYFSPEKLRVAFTFQAKYLGMSPWECPGAFGILSLIEHKFGVYHTQGGLSAISDAMAKVAEANGAKIHLNTPVKQLLLEGKSTRGVILENGDKIYADDVVINADFGHAMTHLFPENSLCKWSKPRLEKKTFSCSTFMLYLGLDKLYSLPHHTIVFADDYRSNVNDIFKNKTLSKDVSIYIRNASVNDPTLAPKGKSAIYILVPVPNQFSHIQWSQEKIAFRKLILSLIAQRTVMQDIEKHIVAEKVITPEDWENDHSVYKGATFNLGHTLTQLLYFRPRNQFEEFKHCYLVGGGTHPGSGLPTIYESGRITANLLSRKHGIAFVTKNLKA